MFAPVLTAASEAPTIIVGDHVATFVNLRAGPSTDSAIIGTLLPDQSAPLIAESTDWYEIEIGGVRGYVHRHWVEKTTTQPLVRANVASAAADSPRVLPRQTVTSFVNVRLMPSVESEVIGDLAPGESLRLLGVQDQWYQVELAGGVIGFVNRQWTRRTAGELPPIDPAAPVVAGKKPARDRTVLARPADLLKQGRSEDAYRLLSRLELQWAGDSGFDYLLGVAALDSGHPGEAIFALERVVKILPDFDGARMELARALFNIGDHDLAEEEFMRLLAKDPPEEVRNIIAAFLDIIRNPPVAETPPQGLIYAMGSGGYDSNANGAADIDEFLGFSLDPRSSEQDSPFVEAAFGGVLQRPLRPGLDWILIGDARHRHNRDADYVDNTYATASVGLGIKKGVNEFNTALAATWSAIDNSFNERGLALDLGWTRPLPDDKAMRATIRLGPVRYTDALKARDLDRLNYSLTIRRPVQDGAGSFDWTLIGGRDIAKDRTTPYSNSRAGARIGGTWQLSTGNLFWGLGALRIPYNSTDFFGTDRKDRQYTANLGIEFVDKPFKGFVFVPNVSFVRNKSNVSIYDNERLQIGVQFRAVR